MLLVNRSAINVFNLVLYVTGRLGLSCMLVILVFPWGHLLLHNPVLPDMFFFPSLLFVAVLAGEDELLNLVLIITIMITAAATPDFLGQMGLLTCVLKTQLPVLLLLFFSL